MGKRQEEGLPWCCGLAEGCFDRSCAGRKPAARGTQASWKLAVQEGKQIEGLELVSNHFGRWPLAVLTTRAIPKTDACRATAQLPLKSCTPPWPVSALARGHCNLLIVSWLLAVWQTSPEINLGKNGWFCLNTRKCEAQHVRVDETTTLMWRSPGNHVVHCRQYQFIIWISKRSVLLSMPWNTGAWSRRLVTEPVTAAQIPIVLFPKNHFKLPAPMARGRRQGAEPLKMYCIYVFCVSHWF
jgi:hypothetical protein